MKPRRQAIIKPFYAMSTIENHSFENESEIMLLSDLKHTTWCSLVNIF